MGIVEKEQLARSQGISYGQMMQMQSQVPHIVKAMVLVKIREIESDLADSRMPQSMIPMARRELYELKLFRANYC